MSNLQDVREKGVKVELDGREFTLFYDLNAFAEIEDDFGVIDEVLEKLGRSSAKTIRALLWAGLLHHHPEVTTTEVGRLIGFQDLGDLSEKLRVAIVGALPNQKVEKPARKVAAVK